MKESMSRRSFLKGSAIMGAGAVAFGLAGCASEQGASPSAAAGDQGKAADTQVDAQAEPEAAPSPADNIKWEAEADMVIVGGGAAGFSAATAVYHENLGTALLLEAAPEELGGGNSRVCGQGVFCPTSVEAAMDYQRDLNGMYTVEEELLRAWAENICENVDWLTDAAGFDAVEKGGAEFPEAIRADEMKWYSHEGKGPWGHTWELLHDAAVDNGCPVYYEARATKLVTTETGDILGVATEDGRNFKANKGVILACGGFENNTDMLRGYTEIGYPKVHAQGTPYNVGDGVKMAQSVGADLWHMNNVSGNGWGIRVVSEDDDVTIMEVEENMAATMNYIWVCGDGSRFINESTSSRHGKMYYAGTWVGKTLAYPAYCIMGQESFDATDLPRGGWVGRTDYYKGKVKTTNAELLEAGLIKKCETVAEVTAVTGLDEAALQATLDRYNGFVADGHDADFHREIATDLDNPSSVNTDTIKNADFTLVPVEAPYYVFQMLPLILNTQGGPKRGVGGEVLDTEGNPIPRLYSAGELGCIYGYKYNLGGNFGEAISSGRLAARSCAQLAPVA